MGLYGPHMRVRGATSAPFPGYMLIGRGENFAWTLTSPEVDIVDTYAERLCGGSRTRYRYKGRCRRMETDQGRDDRRRAARACNVKFRRTVHGPVTGYARVAGSKRVVALARKRSSYGRETVDQIFFQRLTFGRVKTRGGLHRRGEDDAADVQRVLRLGQRDRVLHDGPRAAAPQGRQPGPARRRPRQQRVARLPLRLRPSPVGQPAERAAGQLEQQARAGLPGERFALRAGGTRDARRSCCCASSPASRSTRSRACSPPRTRAPPATRGRSSGRRSRRCSPQARRRARSPPRWRRALDRWAAADGGWIDARRRREGGRRRPGGHRGACGAISPGRRCAGAWAEAVPAARGSQPALRRAAGQQPVRRLAPVHRQGPACAARPRRRRPLPHALLRQGERHARARRALWSALDSAGRAEAARQGTSDPAQWRLATKKIAFTPLPLEEIQYTNRPSGIHMVMQFAP